MTVTFLARPGRRLLLAIGATLAIALMIGIPTDVVPNPLFGRTVPVRWWDYAVLGTTSALGGLVVVTYTMPAACPVPRRESRAGVASGVLGFFAVGCPVCNHLVVLVLGSAGALAWFAPLQPVLGLAGIAVMTWVLRARLRAIA